MKQLLNLVFLIISFYYSTIESITTNLKPTPYSGLSSRKLYVPRTGIPVEQTPLNITSTRAMYYDPIRSAEQQALLEAEERNRQVRQWQLERSLKRQYGAYQRNLATIIVPPAEPPVESPTVTIEKTQIQ